MAQRVKRVQVKEIMFADMAIGATNSRIAEYVQSRPLVLVGSQASDSQTSSLMRSLHQPAERFALSNTTVMVKSTILVSTPGLMSALSPRFSGRITGNGTECSMKAVELSVGRVAKTST
jgi:hypothetical protein